MSDPFHHHVPRGSLPWIDAVVWPASWITIDRASTSEPVFAAYRLRFDVMEAATAVFHVSGDERYELFLDGVLIARGPEKGDAGQWSYRTLSLRLEPGAHVLSSRVWTLGAQAPGAQCGVRHGFLLAAENAFHHALSTGHAPWESQLLDGLTISSKSSWLEFLAGAHTTTDLRLHPVDPTCGAVEGWAPAIVDRPAQSHLGAAHFSHPPYLISPELPPMLNEPCPVGEVLHVQEIAEAENVIRMESEQALPELRTDFQALIESSKPVTIPAGCRLMALIRLKDYSCVYPTLTLAGEGACVEVAFSESLTHESDPRSKKGNRGEFAGKYFSRSHGDSVIAAHEERVWQPIWYRCGLWMLIKIKTSDEALTISRLQLRETRYPLEDVGAFSASGDFVELQPLLMRTLQMCAHDVYYDCPFYEQMMYVGDTRLQILIHLALQGDARLARRAVRLFHGARRPDGFWHACHPGRLQKSIPTFSLIGIAILDDLRLWTQADDLVAECIGSVRSIIEGWEKYRDDTGLIRSPDGWNFVDWSRRDDPESRNGPEKLIWPGGIPPGGQSGELSGVLNIFYLCFLQHAIALEEHVGERELAARLRRLREETFAAWHLRFYEPALGLYADDESRTLYSEHSQCLALLSGLLDDALAKTVSENLFQPSIELAPATYYFDHYYFEACRRWGRIDVLLARQERWRVMLELGAKTAFEGPEPTRSDCHAWSSHPLWHWRTSVLGVRPDSAGFSTVKICPQLGPLKWVEGSVPHRLGMIEVFIEQKNEGYHGHIILPDGLVGVLQLPDDCLKLPSGQTVF